jgi:hypothetical protein
MNSESPKRAGLKQKAAHEFVKLPWISLYLAFFLLLYRDVQDAAAERISLVLFRLRYCSNKRLGD